tara:strand:- start:1086 stop:1271 length:186 start_codon:yes stop_codon:yes gene_type:complete
VEDSERFSSFLISLSAGYLYTITWGNWNYSGGDITGGPSYGAQGFYAKLSLGVAFSGPDDK